MYGVRVGLSVCYLLLGSSLSQNCIGDQGVKKLATMLRDLPKLHCLRYIMYTHTYPHPYNNIQNGT